MLIVAVLFFLRIFPFEASVAVTRLIILLYLALVPRARLQLYKAQHSLGCRRFSTRTFISRSALNLCLMARMGSTFSKRLGENAVIEGEEFIKNLRDNRGGAVVVTFHFGPWELAAETFSARGYRLGALVGKQRMGLFNNYLTALRRRTGLHIFHNLGEAREALKNGMFVATFMDKTRRARKGAWSLPYNDYNISVIPETLAKRTNKELVPFMCYFDSGKLNIRIGNPAPHPRTFFDNHFQHRPYEWLVWGE